MYGDSLETAIDLIKQEGTSLVLLKQDEMIHRADGRGVTPLLALYDDAPEKFRGATVVDRVIGKAAAMILVLGGAGIVWGDLMSMAARDYLRRHGIETGCAELLPLIHNRTETGMCPIEQSVLNLNDPVEGLEVIRKTTRALRDGTLTP